MVAVPIRSMKWAQEVVGHKLTLQHVKCNYPSEPPQICLFLRSYLFA